MSPNLRRYRRWGSDNIVVVKTFEFVCNRLNAYRDGDFVVASIYRPGSAVVIREFFTALTTFFEALVKYRCPVILLGDFNIHTERADDVHATELIDLMTSFDMSQHVKEAAHSAGGCIDLIFTRSECRVTRVTFSDSRKKVCPTIVLWHVVCQSDDQRSHRPPFKVDGGSNSSLTYSKLTCPIRYYVRTWVGRHQPPLMNCLIDIQRSCRLCSTSMLLAISKRDKGAFWHRGTTQSAETWNVLRWWLEEKYRRSHLPFDRLNFIDQLKQQSSFFCQ